MTMLDLFCGLGGASAFMRRHGWDVHGVDTDPACRPDEVADVRTWRWAGPRPDLVWASPPCLEFSRRGMPWLRAKFPGPPPLDMVLAAVRIIRECDPVSWVIENVRGSIRWLTPLLGSPVGMWGAAALWGCFPDIGRFAVSPHKERLSSARRRERAMVPYAISDAFRRACEVPTLFAVGSERVGAA